MRIRGPYHNKSKDLWRIEVVHDDGRTVEITKKTKAEIDKAKVQAQAMVRVSSASAKPIRHRAPDGTLAWYSEALDKVAKRVLRDPSDVTLAGAARVFCQLITAKKQCSSMEEIEQNLGELQQMVQDILYARQHDGQMPPPLARTKIQEEAE